MAYSGNGLSLIGQLIGGKHRSWLYRYTDAIATVLGAGYISDASDRGMVAGDLVTYEKTDDTPPSLFELRCDSISAGGAATLKRGELALTDSIAGTISTTLAANAVKYTAKIEVPALAALANSAVLKLAIPHSFTVLGTPRFRVGASPVTTAAKAATATLQVNGVAATGGVISLVSATLTPAGASLAASAAVTAGGAGTAGQTLEFAISAVTAFVEGGGWFEVDVRNDDLANALSSIAAAS
jgi:hypothetical protein